jgi:biotin carboxylase
VEAPTVLVTDAAYPEGLTVVRSLGRAGWRVVGAHPVPRSRLARSRYEAASVATPDPGRDGLGAGEALAEVARRHNADLVFPTTEKSILALLSEMDRTGVELPLALPSRTSLDAAMDKSRTIDLAVSVGVPAPRSSLVHTLEEAEHAARDIGWPVVIKPVRSHRWTEDGRIETCSVSTVAGPDDLRRLSSSPTSLPALVQEWVDGHGVGVEVLCDRGEIVAAFQHRRIHEVPRSGGRSALREASELDPALAEQAAALMSAMGWTGLAMVEFRRGRDGVFLMEVNGRVWGSIPLAVEAGIDFPLAAARLHLGMPVARHVRYSTGVRCVNLELELRWLASAVRDRVVEGGGSTVAAEDLRVALGALLDPRLRFDVARLEDPGPGLADGFRAVSGILRDAVARARAPEKSEEALGP